METTFEIKSLCPFLRRSNLVKKRTLKSHMLLRAEATFDRSCRTSSLNQSLSLLERESEVGEGEDLPWRLGFGFSSLSPR